ncbi:hypothetical protein LK533_07775 [Sphingomonas sp. PL-96]|uniref:hypothetical protein n=1 Tax=Sphingomonas sp. PL-96 TaxID=2887201 RepID=UPI001E55E963|nr:hypothetical protein [Sphingomonas sp. PL-96]MCC2976572.1 hypothetical protein [Sphingomonas sp. PL-96]
MWQLADARSEARRLLEAHGPAALLGLSDAMSAAVRAGDHKAAERFEKILLQAERELDGNPIPPQRLARWRRTTAMTVPIWPIS